MKKEKIHLDSQLLDYYQSGFQIDVEETAVTDENLNAMDQIVREENCYMKDFEENEKGEIYKIHYIKVTEH